MKVLPSLNRVVRGLSLSRPLVLTVATAVVLGVVGVALGSYLLTGWGAPAAASLSVPVREAVSAHTSTFTTSESPSLPATPESTPSGSLSAATTTPTPTRTASAAAKATTTAATKAATAKTTAQATGLRAMEQQVLAIANTQRSAAGCPALIWNDKLANAARAHSQDMAAKNYFAHNSLDGRRPSDRISAAGYVWTQWAENIAAGQKTAQDVMSTWMDSAGHRANILNCSVKELGVGVATGGSYGTYWTQDFGTR